MKYNIQILSDTEFDRLPYKEAKISLGLADTRSGKAFVRYTHSDELNRYLISHELDHLMGSDRDEIHHGGDGVYYKGFGNVFSAIGSSIAGAGRSVAGAGRSIGGFFGNAAKSIGGAGSSLIQPLSMFGQSAGQAGQQAGQAITRQLNPAQLAASPTNAFQSALRGAGNTLSTSALQSSPTNAFQNFMRTRSTQPHGLGFQTPQLQAPGGIQSPPQVMAPKAPLPTPPAPPTVPQPTMPAQGTAQVAKPQGGGPLGSFFGAGTNMAQLGMGAGLFGYGQTGAKTPQIPDLSQLPSVQRFANLKVENFRELDPDLKAAVENDLTLIDTQEMDQLRDVYKNLRPGADYETDSSYRRDIQQLQDAQVKRRMDTLSKYRYDFMRTNLAATELEMQQLQGLAQLDIDRIMAQTGMDYEEASQFKEAFGQLGGAFIGSGLGLYNKTSTTQPQQATSVTV